MYNQNDYTKVSYRGPLPPRRLTDHAQPNPTKPDLPTRGQFRLMEIRMGLVVSRPLSIESLKMAEGIAGIYSLKPALIGSIFVMT